MIITEYFNTYFKLEEFRVKPEIVVTKLKLAEGMWHFLCDGMEGAGRLENIGGKLLRRTNLGCNCLQCKTGLMPLGNTS